MDPLLAFIRAIPAAAASPTAGVLYIILVIAWVAIIFRVRRYNLLLKNINKIPAKDRANLVATDEVFRKMPAGTTPAQWLRARKLHYLFLGFITICATVIALAALAVLATTKQGNTASTAPPAPAPSEKNLLNFVSIGITRAFLESKLGAPPKMEFAKELKRANYEFESFSLFVVYDWDELIARYTVRAKKPSFQPEIPLLGSCLQCKNFKSFGDETSPTINFPNPHMLSEGFRFYYGEATRRIADGSGKDVIQVRVEIDIDYDALQKLDIKKLYASEANNDLTRRVYDLCYEEGRSYELRKGELDSWRELLTPNSFTVQRYLNPREIKKLDTNSFLSASLCDSGSRYSGNIGEDEDMNLPR